MYFSTGQKFEVHSHEGSMSNMVTDTDKQLDIRRKVDPGKKGVVDLFCICVCVCVYNRISFNLLKFYHLYKMRSLRPIMI